MAETKRIYRTKDERRKRRIRGTLALVAILIFVLMVGIYVGFALGVHYAAKSFVEVLSFVVSNSDIKMDINMTLNQTEMMDYLIDKMGINDTMTKKDYIPPCNPNEDIPRGETGVPTCIAPQEVNKVGLAR